MAALFGKRFIEDDEGIVECFADKSWLSLTASDLKRCEFALQCFTLQGFLYFMPAYLRALLESPDELDSAGDAFLARLIGDGTRRGSRLAEYMDHMTDAQLSVVADVLRHELARQGGWEASAISNEVEKALELIADRLAHG